MEFGFPRSSPHLFAATLVASCLLVTSLSVPGTSFAWLARSPCPLGVFLHDSSPSPGVWNWKWQGKWHALFPGAGLTFPHPTAEDGRGSTGRLRRVPDTLGSGQLGLSGHRGSRGAGIRGVSSRRALATLRFPKEPPGGELQAPGSGCFLLRDSGGAGGVPFKEVRSEF